MPDFGIGEAAAVAGSGAAIGGSSFVDVAGTAAAAGGGFFSSVSPWLAGASLVSSVFGTAQQYQGAKYQAQAMANMYAYQAQVAANNQTIANQMATAAEQAGESKVDIKRLQTASTLGAIQANAGASGLDVTSGSKLDVQSSAQQMGELDALTIRNNAARESYGYKVQGLSYGAQASLDEAAAQNALTSGNIQAFSSLAGGVSSVADKFLRFQSAGLLF